MSDNYYELSRLGVSFRPIDKWPGRETPHRTWAPFSATLGTTVGELSRELKQLAASHVVIQVALREQDIRMDGFPKSGRRASHPGVIVAFDSRKVGMPLRYACDKFLSWEDNLRAIVKSMEALRMVARYGVADDNQQYTGWRQLTAGGAMLHSEAVEFAREHGALNDDGTVDRKQLLRVTHPDTGGDDEAFKQAQQAVAALT